MLKSADVREMFDTVKNAVRAEDKAKVAEIAAAYFEAVSENFELREENARLRSLLAEKSKTRLVAGSLFIEDSNGELCGPICPACYENAGIVSLLGRVGADAHCGVCKARLHGTATDKCAPVNGQRIG